MATYTQQLEIDFKTPEAAGKASVSITPLYDDYTWAISSRWDDNNVSDLKMRDTLAAHGHKGTFYLNSAKYWQNFTDVARKLLEGGNSIGGHSLTHPMLTYCSRNRIFEEVARIRAEWEALADTQVLSYTFSFCRYHNALEGGTLVQSDINRALERAGYYNIANHRYHGKLKTDMIISPIMPSDGADIDDFAQAALNDEAFRREHPNLSYSMHVWYKTPEAWKKFEDQLDKYGHKEDWWYCNQNQYAGYRYQFLHGTIGPVEREGNTVRVSIKRPALLDLNDPTPLTFAIDGVDPSEVAGVRCATGNAVISERRTSRCLIHLHHDRDQALPTKIGRVHNADNRAEIADGDSDADFPDIKVLLHFRGGKVRTLIDNRGSEPLTNVRITYRLPLAWKEGVVRRSVEDVPSRSRREDAIAPSPAETDYKYNSGLSYFLGQIDFVRGGKAGRIHASCHVKNTAIDRSYPQGGFSRLGPIPAGKFDIDKLRGDIAAGNLTAAPWSLSDGTRFEWTVDDSPFDPPFLDPETVRTYGAFRCDKAICYILQSDIRSPREQQVDLIRSEKAVPHLFLNGQEVSGGKGTLRKGDNRLVLVFKSLFSARRFSQFSSDHAGCFLRIARPGTFERITDIRFAPPTQ